MTHRKAFMRQKFDDEKKSECEWAGNHSYMLNAYALIFFRTHEDPKSLTYVLNTMCIVIHMTHTLTYMPLCTVCMLIVLGTWQYQIDDRPT